jgi:hypothetical protein
MLGKQGVRLRIHGTPKLGFGEFIRCQAFCQQRVEFLVCPCKTRHTSLLNCGQGSFHNLLNGRISTTADNGLNAPLLIGCESDCHALRLYMSIVP